jgi:hypothetical protein
MANVSDKQQFTVQPDSSSARIFPPIDSELYNVNHELAELIPDQQVARKLLALAHQNFNRWQRLVGWNLDSTGQMGYLLLQHRLAMEAELAAQWERANFFWNQVQIQFKALSKRDDVWQALVLAVANEPGVTVMGNPLQLRQRLVDELLIDTHYAFYQGLTQQVEKLSLQDRAFIHIDYIQKLLNFSARSQDELLSMLRLPWEQRLALYQEAKKWKEAVALCTERLKYFPNSIDYQNALVEAHFSATSAQLHNGSSEAEGLKDAKTLQRGIERLEKSSQDYPYNLSAFEFLGYLHHLRAIALGNGNCLSEALVEVQKAIAHNPYLEQAIETRNQLIQAMQQLQAHMRDISPNTTLTEKGKRLRAEADKGFAPMNDYSKSATAKATIYALNIAQAMSLWRRIGLPEPEVSKRSGSPAVMHTRSGEELPTESAPDWSRQALLLVDGLNSIFNNPPQNPWDLAAAWEAVVVKMPELAELDRGLIFAFLDRKLFRSTEETMPPKTPVPPLEPPILTSVATKRKRSAEPFILWLLSRQDIRIKLQAVIATVLVLTAAGLTIQDTSVRSARDAAYRQILEANQGQDYLKVLEGAEKFFANTPLSGKDGRDQQVKNLYSKALVRWFAQQTDPLNADTQARIKRYRAVMSNSTQPENQP